MDISIPFRAALKSLIGEMGHGGQAEIADRAGVNRQYLNRILHGKKAGSEEARRQIALALGYEYEEMLNLGRQILGGENVELPANAGSEFTDDERTLIEALREIDPIRRRGVIITALDQLNASLQDKEIKRNQNKKKLIQDAIKDLSRVVGAT